MVSLTLRQRTWFYLFLLLGLVGLLYGPIVGHPFSQADDPAYILLNPEITNPGAASGADLFFQPHIGYIVPITGLFDAALYAVGDGEPWVFHLASLVFFGLLVTALFSLLLEWSGERPGFALCAAALFAAHPLVVEPIAWATGLKDLLMGGFVLWGTLAFVLGLKRGSKRLLWVSAALGVCALLSKPTGAFIGLVWALYALYNDRSKAPLKSALWASAVPLLLALPLMAMSWMINTEVLPGDPQSLEGTWQVPLTLGYQLEHFFWPAELFPRYPIIREAGFEDFHTWLGCLAIGIFFGALFRLRKRPKVALGLGLAFCVYLPVSGVLPFPRMVGDSYLLVPLAGLSMALTAGVTSALEAPRRAAWTKRLLAVCLVLVAVLSVRAVDQRERWRSAATLWYPATQEYDNWPLAWMSLAEGLRFEGEVDRAVGAYEQLFAYRYEPSLLHMLAIMLVRAGDLSEAECVFAEDIFYGSDQARALSNHAALLISNEEHLIEHLDVAKMSLDWSLLQVQKGIVKWPPERVEALMRRLATVGPPSQDLPEWPKRNCPSLQVSPTDASP